jgi:hypothetical protein
MDMGDGLTWNAMLQEWPWFAGAVAVLVIVIALLILLKPKSKRQSNTFGDAADNKERTLTGRIDFIDPHSAGEHVLQVEETRIVKSLGGVERREIRWRGATLDEAKMVLVSYHAQRNLLMSPSYNVSAPTRTKQGVNGQAATPDAKLKDETHGEGTADVDPLGSEVGGSG